MKSFVSIVTEAHPFVSEAAWQHGSRELLQQQVQSQDGQQTPGAKHLSRMKHTQSHLWLTAKKQQHKHNSDCAHLESSGFSVQSWTSRLSVAALRPLSRWPVCRVFVAMHLGWVYIMGLAPGGLFRLSVCVCVCQLDLPPRCHHYFPTSEAAVCEIWSADNMPWHTNIHDAHTQQQQQQQQRPLPLSSQSDEERWEQDKAFVEDVNTLYPQADSSQSTHTSLTIQTCLLLYVVIDAGV